MSARIEMAGKRFGRWTVIDYSGAARWNCRCDCGTEKPVDGKSLRKGETRGCIKCHPALGNQATHGGSGSRLYSIWCGIKARCENPNEEAYPRYGGRGIVVCAAWREDFAAFQAWAFESGYSASLSIDRQDNDGPYSPDNCRWADTQQARNTRSNVVVEFEGERMTLAELSERTGVSYDLLKQRISRRGWDVDRAVREPSRGNWRSR